MKYFVITSDGQKFGPADIVLLNQWIVEGRLQPSAMLEEEGSNLQVRASTLPALRFPVAAPASAPPVAAPNANPYGPPQPMASYQPQAFQARQTSPPGRNTSGVTNQILVGWACTLGAPVLIFFTAIGLFLIIFGVRAAASLYQQGLKGHAIALFIINALSGVLWLGIRVAFVSGHPLFGG
jgi:hypothetical protein